eukprot:403354776
MVTSPRVGSYDFRLIDLQFGTENYFIVDTQTELRVGWEFLQEYGLWPSQTYKYWRVRLNGYGEPSFTAHPELQVNGAYYGEVTADLTQFRGNAYSEMLFFFDTNYICLNVGWNVDDQILFTVETSMNFQDCYKIIISTLWDLSSFDTTKIMDQCIDSNDESVQLYKYNPITAQTDTLWFGSGANGGNYCRKLPFTYKNGGQFLVNMFQSFLENAKIEKQTENPANQNSKNSSTTIPINDEDDQDDEKIKYYKKQAQQIDNEWEEEDSE